MKMRHENLDTLFSKLERGFRKYEFKVGKIDSIIYVDSTYKKANLSIKYYTGINSYSEMTIKDCIYVNGQWYLTPNIDLQTIDFVRWDVLYEMSIRSARLNPRKDTFSYTKCDTFFVGIDALLIDSHTYIYKGDTFKCKLPLKKGAFVINCR